MQLLFRQLNPAYCRTYLVGDAATGEVALVDPVLDHLDLYLAALAQENYKLRYVIDTHAHADHISGGAALKDLTDCEYVMHARSLCRCAELRVRDGSRIAVGGLSIRVLYTPGHAPDAICLLLPGILLTGDTLLLPADGAGRDDMPGGNAAVHWASLQKLLALPTDLIVYPAHVVHGGHPVSLAVQKEKNRHLWLHSQEEYREYLAVLQERMTACTSKLLCAIPTYAQDVHLAWMPVDLPSCALPAGDGAGVNEQEVIAISALDLKARLAANARPVLLDVREAAELEGALGHLPDIVHIPLGQLCQRIDELSVWQHAELIVVCRSGARAYTAAQILQQVGFSKVAILDGGMLAWYFLQHAPLY